ncbi:hypothetical protein AAES_152150 [Amazona aestiva]|uniref:Uncharacterized protein n=1 Tax=Amazona aestiva TaxID=12930 RepID=A0A0Q3QP87_AMAAE|nr:hypothetical protein AAES_152150 [Amazona aestiva]
MAALARSVLVTGSNRGIGLELVRQLAASPRPPQHIFATCRDPGGPRGKDTSLGQNQKIIESTRLEKTFKIFKSNRSPALPRPPLNHVTEGLLYTVCEHFQGQ